ncbi:hypothetical protein BDZ45DRAFT_194296 [Acephala macrosclerotiorum]|nr:hypothetical protein BDZ45DRAFT_194296 [Acephala macrosclerotiorum]
MRSSNTSFLLRGIIEHTFDLEHRRSQRPLICIGRLCRRLGTRAVGTCPGLKLALSTLSSTVVIDRFSISSRDFFNFPPAAGLLGLSMS